MKRTYYNFQESEPIHPLTPLSDDDFCDINEADINAVLSQLMPSTETTYTIIDPKKYNLFLELSTIAIKLAANIRGRLIIDEDTLSGCFILIAEEINATQKCKSQFLILTSAADEISIKVSVDTGEHLPTDIDGLIQYEFWYDYYHEISV